MLQRIYTWDWYAINLCAFISGGPVSSLSWQDGGGAVGCWVGWGLLGGRWSRGTGRRAPGWRGTWRKNVGGDKDLDLRTFIVCKNNILYSSSSAGAAGSQTSGSSAACQAGGPRCVGPGCPGGGGVPSPGGVQTPCGRGTWWRGLAGVAVLGWRLDLVIWGGFPDLHDSMVLRRVTWRNANEPSAPLVCVVGNAPKEPAQPGPGAALPAAGVRKEPVGAEPHVPPQGPCWGGGNGLGQSVCELSENIKNISSHSHEPERAGCRETAVRRFGGGPGSENGLSAGRLNQPRAARRWWTVSASKKSFVVLQGWCPTYSVPALPWSWPWEGFSPGGTPAWEPSASRWRPEPSSLLAPAGKGKNPIG